MCANCPTGSSSRLPEPLPPADGARQGVRVVGCGPISRQRWDVRRILNYYPTWYRHAGRNPLAAAGSRRCHLPQFFWAGRVSGLLAQMAAFVLGNSAISGRNRLRRSVHPQSPFALDPGKLECWMYRAASHMSRGRGLSAENLEKADVQDRISVITNGVDLGLFPLLARPAFLHLWGLEGKFVCSYVGTSEWPMVYKWAIERQASQQKGRDDIRFVLVGDGASGGGSRSRQGVGRRRNGRFTGGSQGGNARHSRDSDACLVHLKKCELFTSVMPRRSFETMGMGRPLSWVSKESPHIVMEAHAGIRWSLIQQNR